MEEVAVARKVAGVAVPARDRVAKAEAEEMEEAAVVRATVGADKVELEAKEEAVAAVEAPVVQPATGWATVKGASGAANKSCA